MRILLVADKPDLEAWVKSLVSETEHFVVHYQHPLKALDNLGEVRPQLIIWDYNDFPRHWKICAAWCRDEQDMADSRFILVSDSALSTDERNKTQAFPRLSLLETGYFSDEFSQLFSGLAPLVPAGPTPLPPASLPDIRKICLWHPEAGQLLAGSVSRQQGNCLEVHFAASARPFFQSGKEKTVYTQARALEKHGARWVKLQLLEVTADQDIKFALI